MLRFVFAVMLLIPMGGFSTKAGAQEGPVPGRFVVKFTAGARVSNLRASLAAGQQIEAISKARIDDNLRGAEHWDQWHIFYTDQKDITAHEVTNLLGSENVEYIEPDYYLTFFDFPSDSLFSYQWHLHNEGQVYLGIERIDGRFNDTLRTKSGVSGFDIGIDSLYNNPPAESTRVVVAIVDSGTDLLHPELRDRLWKNPDEIPNNNIDDDHNGFVDDTLGYDISGDTLAFFDHVGDNDPTDEIGHGTHIAGIIASRADDYGVVGIAPMAEIMSVKIRPNGTSAVGAAGIIYAVIAGANVINVSWGTPYESAVLGEAMDIARENGVFVSCAAGNSGGNDIYYPAGFTSSFTVAASNSEGFLTSFTTWGPGIDVVAPGLDILSLRATGTDMYAQADEPAIRIIGADSLYYLSDGTSMAAPMVSGAAALLQSIRPDLTLTELEDIIRLGARDIVDPWNQDDSLPGPDTVSGYGHLDVSASFQLLTNGGIHIVEPVRQNRYVGGATVRIVPVAGYFGSWSLEYSTNPGAGTWSPLASASSLPEDSIAYTFDSEFPSSHYYLRVTDSHGNFYFTSFNLVNANKVEIVSPQPGEEYNYTIPVKGSAYGIGLDSLVIEYRGESGPSTHLISSTGEFFDSLIYTWNASGLVPGNYSIELGCFFGDIYLSDSVTIHISSAFADGWPQTLMGRGSYTAVCSDLDKDGVKEIIVGTTYGLNVFHADGQPVEGFPVLDTFDCRCVPAVYDIDRDGQDEVIFTNKLGIFAVEHDGSFAKKWPRFWPGVDRYVFPPSLGSGFPNPVVTELGVGDLVDSAIVCIADNGLAFAFEFDGTPYFRSADPPVWPPGLFASFNEIVSTSFFFAGNAVSSCDLTGDGQNEVVVSFSSSNPVAGVGIFEGRTGQPAFDRPRPYVIENQVVYGTILADLNDDELPEIISMGYDSTGMRQVWAKTKGIYDLPGWPLTIPEVAGYRGSFPMVADLDLDGSPEVLFTFFEFDVSSLFVFRADGSPYVSVPGRPTGELFTLPMTLGTPIVANLTGDQYPEIVIRSGYVLPGTGNERIHILDYVGVPIPGWPINTPAPARRVFSTAYVPMVDDVDSDGLVELVLVGEADEIYVWDFDASYDNGTNTSRLFVDNLNSSHYVTRQDPTDVPDDDLSLPLTFSLAQNYPNPFNPATTIEFSLNAKSQVKLQVFNILGQQVNTLIDDELRPGKYSVNFDGSSYASGAYFYRLQAGTRHTTRKMILLK